MSCSGADDAVLSVTVPIGEDPADVFWVTGLDTLFGSVLTGMGPGTYSVFVPGCPVPDFVFVQEPPPISIFQISSSPPTCDAPCGGTAIVQAIGGTEPYNYSWSHDAGESSDAASGLCQGSTAVSVVDSLGCGAISQVFLDIPYPTASISSTAPTCEGLDDATLSASASGGSGAPFSFVWDHGPIGADLTGVAPGSYNVTATDAGGCTATYSLLLVDSPPLTVSATSSPVACWGESNGTATAVADGEEPIAYVWLFPEGSTSLGATQSGLAAGIYSLTATDVLGCVGEASVEVTQPALLTAELLAVSAACAGETNGAVAVAPSGGTPIYDAVWTLPDGSTDSGLDLQNIGAGMYTVNLTDFNGCSWNGGVEVAETEVLSVDFSMVPPTCFGESSGAIVATPAGGTGAIVMTWSNGESAPSLSGLSAGIYGISLLDEAGCSLDTLAVLSEPDELLLSFDSSSPPCAGEATGWATAFASGGNAPWFYAWNGPMGLSVGPSIVDAVAGNYEVGVVDQLGCTAVGLVVLNQVDSIVFDLLVTDVSCAGNDGAIVATTSGGTGGITTSWTDGVTTWEQESISDLSVGLYSGLSTDAAGCAVSAEVQIEAADPLSVVLNWTVPSCAGEASSFSAEAHGGLPNYTLVLALAAEPTLPINPSLWLALLEGDYTLHVEDAAGCTYDTTFSLVAPAPLDVVAVVSGISCFGLADGEIMLSPSGGLPTIEANWVDAPDLPSPALIRTGLSPGFYIAELVDGAGCSLLLDTIWVDGADALALEVVVTPESCDGINLGTVLLEGSGGTPPFFLTLDGLQESGPDATPDSSTSFWSALQAGDYAAAVVDEAGCSVEILTTVTQPSPFSWNVVVTDSACAVSPGAISISWVGGTPPFSWSGAGAGGLWTSADTSGLAPGAYAISMADGAGCLSDSVVTVGLVATLSLTLEATHPTCVDFVDGILTPVTTGGSPAIQLGIDGPSGALNVPFDQLPSGLYTGWSIDARGCTDTVEVELVDPPALSANDSSWATTCWGEASGGALLFPLGGSLDYTVQWADGSTTLLHDSLSVGSHAFALQDGQGCVYSGSVEISTPNPFTATTDWSPPVCSGGTDGTLTFSLSGGTGSFTLSFDEQDPTILAQNTPVVWTDLEAGPRNISWTDAMGCTGDTTLSLPEPASASLTLSIPELACTGDSINVHWSVVQEDASDTLIVISGLLGGFVVGSEEGDIVLGSGTHTIALENGAGCLVDSSFIVAPLSALTATTDILQPDCQNQPTGSALITPTGAAGDWIIVVEGAADTTVLEQLLPGVYPYALMDDVGCVFRDTINIHPASEMTIVATSIPASCAELEDGSITAQASNAVGNVFWAIDPPDATFLSPSSFVDLGAGSYWIEATDEAGCSVEIAVEVSAPLPIPIEILSLVHPSCTGDEDGWIELATIGSPSPYTYTWFYEGDSVGNSYLLDNMAEGNYSLLIEDIAGCQATVDQIQMVAQGDVTLTLPSDTALCAGSQLQISATVQGASSIAWTIDGASVSIIEEVTSVVQLDTALWICTASQQGCVKSGEVQVVGLPNPVALAGPDLTLLFGEQAQVGSPAPPESDPWTWTWSPADAFENAAEHAPWLEPVSASIELLLLVTSEDGCTARDTSWVHLIPELQAPSGFTPNGDGWNDRWNIAGALAYPSLEVIIFNRWGAIVHEMPDPTAGWDGTVGGVALPVGTYYTLYRASESFIEFERTGTLTIMR